MYLHVFYEGYVEYILSQTQLFSSAKMSTHTKKIPPGLFSVLTAPQPSPPVRPLAFPNPFVWPQHLIFSLNPENSIYRLVSPTVSTSFYKCLFQFFEMVRIFRGFFIKRQIGKTNRVFGNSFTVRIHQRWALFKDPRSSTLSEHIRSRACIMTYSKFQNSSTQFKNTFYGDHSSSMFILVIARWRQKQYRSRVARGKME